MKKTYDLKLLTGGIILMLSLIASFVLQSYFGQSYLTMSYTLDTFVLMAVAFIFILQFKNFIKVSAIILVVYGALNILYGITGSSGLSGVFESTDLEVIFILGLLLAHVIFEIAVLFVLLHVTQPRFEMAFTKRFVSIAMIASLLLLMLISPLVTFATFQSVIRIIFSVITIAALYFAISQMVFEKTEEPEPEVNMLEVKQKELKRLYERGIITESEYQTRLDKINSK